MRLKTGNTEKDLMSSYSITWSVDTSLEMADMCECEKIAKKIEKTSESIKKHRALKTDRIEDIALDRYFKPIIKPL